jgi:hypothetical protein
MKAVLTKRPTSDVGGGKIIHWTRVQLQKDPTNNVFKNVLEMARI